MTRTIKRLYVYLYEPERIVVDRFEADVWEDFMIVRIKGVEEDAAMVYEQARQAIANIAPEKQFIIIPDGLDVDFYGVEVKDDE